MKLTASEKARGWVLYLCPSHGPLLAAPPTAVVVCTCGKKAVKS